MLLTFFFKSTTIFRSLFNQMTCFPNSLLMATKTNSTNDKLTSSTLAAIVWLSTKSFHLLFLSRLECPKAVFWAQSYSSSSSMIRPSGKSSSSLCWWLHPLPWHPSSFILQIGRLKTLPSLQNFKKKKEKTSWSNAWNKSINTNIINLVSDQVTPPWTCCFCFPNNWWRSSMPNMRSELSP